MNAISFNIRGRIYNWLEEILRERFNLELQIIEINDGISLLLKNADLSIKLPKMNTDFFNEKSTVTCGEWNTSKENWDSILDKPIPTPGMSKLPFPLIKHKKGMYIIKYDIMGLLYWTLSRQEEVTSVIVDSHNRFPASASHAYKHNYLERPIVDEWLHILGQVIKKQWPHVELKKHKFQLRISHDVDIPSQYGFSSGKKLLKSIAQNTIRYHDYGSFLFAPWIRLNTRTYLHPKDPFNTFNWIMDNSEKNNLTSAFYILCGGSKTEKHADYSLDHPAIRTLLRHIHERGHEIGLHPDYNTYKSPEKIINAAQQLKQVCSEERIVQSEWGGRMHYLQWEHPTTLLAWESAGMSYDSTLGYADQPGFRCGSCFEYPAFDPVSKKRLNLRLRPLIVMESTIIAKHYLNLGYSKESLSTFKKFKNTCKQVGGQFTLLWHNSHLTKKEDRDFYQKLIAS